MSMTVDSLQLEVQASSQNAADGLKALEDSLNKIKNAVGRGLGLTRISNDLGKLSSALNGVTAAKVANLGQLGATLKAFESIGNLKISSTIASSITNISKATDGLTSENVMRIREASSAIATLSSVSGIKISSTIANGITSIGTASKTLNGVDFAPIRELAASLEPLNSIRGLSLTSIVNQLGRIPEVAREINAIDLNRFTANVASLASALRPLGDAMSRVSAGFSSFPARVRQVTDATNRIPASNNAAIASYARLGASIAALYLSAKKIAQTIAGFINKSNEYVENLNLFTVAMGDFAGQAQEYAEHVSDVMGIDPSDWMRNQGIFMTLATGFGVVTDRAYTMSKNLTQLGYDISSFFNIPIEESMQKLESGISGEIEPLRRLGYDLSQTRLQAIAASLGIKTAVADMTQAEKAQLRYYAIMTQVTTAQGDMARTLNSPANQLRILSASATQAARAIGNIFIPILNTVLPVAIAAAKAIRAVAVAIASLFGYTLPSVDFSVAVDGLGGVSDGMDDVATGAGNAGGAAKKLKSILMGFDEINQLPDLSSGGGGGSGGSGGGTMSGLDFELPEYDFLANMVTSQVDTIYRKLKPMINWITDNLNSILALIKAAGGAFLMWKVAKTFIPDLGLANSLLSRIKGLAGFLATLGIMVTLVYNFDTNFAKTGNIASLVGDGISTLVGTLISDSILRNVYKAKPGLGGGIALTISAATTIKAIYDGFAAGDFIDNRNALVLALVAAAKGAFAGASLAKAAGVSVLGGIGVGLAITAVATVVAKLSGLGKHDVIEDNIQWGTIRLEADGIANIINRMFNYDVKATVDIIDTSISNAGEARAALNSAISNFSATLLPFQFNLKTGEADVSALITQAEGLIEAFKADMKARKETISLALTIVPHRAEDGTDMSSDILGTFLTAEVTLNNYMTTLGNQLSDALNQGMVDGAFDQALITELSTKLAQVSQAVAIGTAQGEFSSQVGLTLSQLNKESFGAVVDQYAATVSELNQKLTEIETAGKSAMEGQLAGLITVQQQLTEAGDFSGAAELQTQIDTINGILANWDVGANVALALQQATEPMRAEWASALQKIFGGNLSELVNFSSFTPFILGTAATWDTDMLTREFETAINQSIIDAIGKDNAEYLFSIADSLGVTGFDLLGTDIQQQLYDTLASAVGESRADEVFASLGLTIGSITTEVAGAATAASEAGSEISGALASGTTDAENMDTALADAAKTAKSDLPDITKNAEEAGTAAAGVGEQFTAVKDTIVEIPSEKSIALTIANYSSTIMRLNAIRDAIKGITGATINLKVKAGLTAGARNFLKQLKDLDTEASTQINRVLNLSQFASGGYPRSGELFIANENGRQEMVGRIGNRAAVANQDQIGDAIFQYMDAHSEANGGIDYDVMASSLAGAMKAMGIGAVYLDGRQLANSINRESQRTGRPAINY